MANQVGKRYVCTVCRAEFIVTRGGKGELHCCGKKMEIKKQLRIEMSQRAFDFLLTQK